MKVRLLTGLVGPEINLRRGDIYETPEGPRWVAAGIAEPVIETQVIETATVKPTGKRTATVSRKKA
jgi:hypothetical protein